MNFAKRLHHLFQIRQLVERVGLSESYFAFLIDNEYCPFADSGHRRGISQDPEFPRNFAMGIKIRAHREAHHADVFFLPCDMAQQGVGAYVQNLGIERSELLQLGVERRKLRRSSRSPVQRMKCHYHVLLAAKITELHFQPPFALDRGQLEIRCQIANFQGHNLSLALRRCRTPAHSLNLGLSSKECYTKIKGGRSRPLRFDLSGLDAADVLSLPALGALDHVELYLLTFLQAAESGRLNG